MLLNIFTNLRTLYRYQCEHPTRYLLRSSIINSYLAIRSPAVLYSSSHALILCDVAQLSCSSTSSSPVLVTDTILYTRVRRVSVAQYLGRRACCSLAIKEERDREGGEGKKKCPSHSRRDSWTLVPSKYLTR